MTCMPPEQLDQARASLATALHTDPATLTFLDRLGPDALERLTTLVATAVERDGREIDEGLDRTIGFIPRPLRGRVRRVLVPEEDH
jgi:hypothetical protein